jgi:hypothetical protein
MSFRCESCKKVQEDGTKVNKVVTAVRNVTYPTVKGSDGKIKTPVGRETVKELSVCPECAMKEFRVDVVGEKILTKEEV